MAPLLASMERVAIAWESGDYDTLRSLLHPEGSWALVSNEPRLFTDRDKLVAAIQFLRETTCYRIYTMKYEVLGGSVVLASAYIRTPAGRHGHRLARHYFLLQAKDGLLYRREHFYDEREARSAFAEGWSQNGQPPRQAPEREQPTEVALPSDFTLPPVAL